MLLHSLNFLEENNLKNTRLQTGHGFIIQVNPQVIWLTFSINFCFTYHTSFEAPFSHCNDLAPGQSSAVHLYTR